jgi:flagellar hook-associated protein 2
MASVFSALNIGSGLDVRALVTELVAAERAPRQQLLDDREARVTARLSAQGQFRSALDALVGALDSRTRSGSLSGIPAVSDPAVLSLRVDPGRVIAPQSLEVRALARVQTLASPPIADAGAPVGQGTLTIRFGTVGGAGAPTGFTAGGRPDLPVAIGPDRDSLTGLRDAINDAAAAAGAPVRAELLTDAGGTRLQLRGQTGAASGFLVETSAALAAFAFPEFGTAALQRTEVAADAEVALNGLPLRRATNDIADLVPGARLTLLKAAPGAPVTLSAERDPAELTRVARDLASALGELSAIGRELTRGASAAGSAGALVADAGARRAVTSVARLTTTPLVPASGNAPTRLSDIGVSVTRDGGFTVDEARLARAVRDHPAGIEALVTALNKPTAFGSPAGPLRAIADQFRGASQGSGNDTALARESADIARQREALNARMERLTAQYTRQFAALDRSVGQSRGLQQYLQQQIDLWTRDSN